MPVELIRILKRTSIFLIIFVIYGIISKDVSIYFGVCGGTVLAMIGFYISYIDARASVHSSSPFRITISSYIKRYILYGIFLGVSLKYFGVSTFVGGIVGLLSIKFNIILGNIINILKNLTKKLNHNN